MKFKHWFPNMLVFLISIIALTLASCESYEETETQTLALSELISNQGQKEVSVNEAVDVAAIFQSKQNGEYNTENRSSLNVDSLFSERGDKLAYIINFDDGGWVVISATHEYHPILAYSDEGFFTPDSADKKSGLNIWISEIAEAMATIDALDESSSNNIALEWMDYSTTELGVQSSGLPGGNTPEAVTCRNRLKELNDTYYQEGWSFSTLTGASVNVPQSVYSNADQYSSPYQYTIIGVKSEKTSYKVDSLLSTRWHQKSDYNKLCPNGCVGCVPLAMGQIMKFHRTPSNFDWSDMKDREATTATQQLLRQIGIDIGAKYEKDETKATIDDAIKGFKKYGYNVTKKSHAASDVAIWMDTYRYPVYMRGKKADGKGHAWVCDGVNGESRSSKYYVEYLVNGSYSNLNLTHLENPELLNSGSTFKLHYNWGELVGVRDAVLIGWYIDTQLPSDKEYTIDRTNLYIKPN